MSLFLENWLDIVLSVNNEWQCKNFVWVLDHIKMWSGYNNSWLGFSKKSELCTQKKEKNILQKISPHLSQLMLRWLIGIIFRRNNLWILKWQHIQRMKITILGANWQLFRLERIAKCSYFILSTQNIKFHWIVMKNKEISVANLMQ